MKRIMILIAITLFVSACYKETGGLKDTSVDTAPADGEDGICENGIDDDGDTVADCGDDDGLEDCSEDPVCLEDASTDALADSSEDSPADLPDDICTNGIDDDGDTVADCGDTFPGLEDCSDDPACVSEDASTDALEDPAPDTVEDPSEDPVPDPDPDPSEDVVEEDTSVDTGSDPDAEDTTSEEVSCSPTPGEATFTWSFTGSRYAHVRAECENLATRLDGTTYISEPWSVDWNTLDGTADASATDAFSVSHTVLDAPGVETMCNFVAFDSSGSGHVYAIGSYNSITGSHDTNGTLTVTSGTCSITSDLGVDPAPRGSTDTGPAINYVLVLP